MYLLKSCVIAFSMYSKIPMPRVEWSEKNMKYAMCFFPAVGVVLGAIEIIVGGFLLKMGASPLLFGAVMTLLPVLVTGGIHMDGFMDTMDALNSYGTKEKKLAILKDSHSGAFAVLGLCCYFLWSTAMWGEAKAAMLPVLGGSCVLSRSLSGFSVMAFPPARDSGLARTFQDGASRKRAGIFLICWVLCSGAFVLLADIVLGGAVLIASILVFLHYRRVCTVQFGGITGDLAGYFLELCELAALSAVVIVQKV